MTRIRTVKPEFWSSPDTAACADPWARLLFISMWNWADDSGRGTANPKELAGFAFPNDDGVDSTRVRRMLGEVSRAFGVILYKVGGRTYYAIPSWERHQKIDRKSTAKHPAPEEGEPWDPDPEPRADQHRNGHSASGARVLVESSSSPRRDDGEGSGTGTGEQGNRGTTTSPTADAAGRSDEDWFVEFWKAYPRKVDKQDALRAFKAALKRRIDPNRLIRAAQSYARQNVGRETKYLKHAATWLNKGSYDNEPEQAHLSLVPDLPLSDDPVLAFDELRRHGDARASARLLGIPWVEPSQRPSDPTPPQEWLHARRVEFIDRHETEIRAALTKDRAAC